LQASRFRIFRVFENRPGSGGFCSVHSRRQLDRGFCEHCALNNYRYMGPHQSNALKNYRLSAPVPRALKNYRPSFRAEQLPAVFTGLRPGQLRFVNMTCPQNFGGQPELGTLNNYRSLQPFRSYDSADLRELSTLNNYRNGALNNYRKFQAETTGKPLLARLSAD
jgi:hypothetical protein